MPDLPTCVAVGKTFEEVQGLISEGISLYIETLKEDGKPIPEPVTQVGCVSVAV